MQKNTKVALFGSLKIMVMAAIFVAISIVCGKYLAIPGGNVLRFSFENLPILMSGIAFGPAVGAAVGIVADLVGCFLVGYTVNPILTVASALMGVFGGVIFRLCKKWSIFPRLTLTVTLSHLICSVGIKTVGLSAFYSIPLWELMLWRLLNYIIVGALELTLIYILVKNKAVRKQLGISLEE